MEKLASLLQQTLVYKHCLPYIYDIWEERVGRWKSGGKLRNHEGKRWGVGGGGERMWRYMRKAIWKITGEHRELTSENFVRKSNNAWKMGENLRMGQHTRKNGRLFGCFMWGRTTWKRRCVNQSFKHSKRSIRYTSLVALSCILPYKA